MLQLKGIKKDYTTGGNVVHALKGLDISFRKNEFVSILGHSGCGKTTLLNIIGGLDHYTEGTLYIDGVSTQKYGDRDWDAYRNRRIGFIFQSYNLIPHQTIQMNVELALTIGGVDKKQRAERAREALDKVGLSGLYDKKPNQLSGGQCQRVAIARALVNEPEILLADEPTGALDSETSEQIMQLIRAVADERLVIMVTHNPELAERYSTRIVRLSDGNIIADSDPYYPEQDVAISEDGQPADAEGATTQLAIEDAKWQNDDTKCVKRHKKDKARLSFWSAFKLSARNLLSKARRTALVCFAGSIGIIGVALVLAISSGVQNYIDNMQNDMLAGNPIRIEESTFDFNAIMESMTASQTHDAIKENSEDGYIDVDSMIEYLVERSKQMEDIQVSNDITEQYVAYLKAMPEDILSAMSLNYNLNIGYNLYTDYEFTGHPSTMSLAAAKQVYSAMLSRTEFSEYSSFISSMSDTFRQAPDNAEYILSQYDFLTSPELSKVATKADELMIVVDDERELTDMLFAQLGYFTQDEFFNVVYRATEDEKYDPTLDKDRFTYDELLNKTFTWYPNDTVYTKNDSPLLSAVNPFYYNAYADPDWTTGKQMHITGILVKKDGQNYGCLRSGFYYTSALAEQIIADSLDSELVKFIAVSDSENYVSTDYMGQHIGITFTYDYSFDGVEYTDNYGYLGEPSMNAYLSASGQNLPVTYTVTLRAIGGKELPNSISIYPSDFNSKDMIVEYLDKWNGDEDIVIGDTVLKAEERSEITYTDTLSLIITMINTVIKMITYALIAFTALSLVVSTVMIAIITYVSVIERIKEIGVIRSLGGRKRDVSALFIAETLIIGTISGVIGIVVTYILQFVINLIVRSLANIPAIAALSAPAALIMIAISILLTLISGVIPARLAAKKDPAVALRTE